MTTNEFLSLFKTAEGIQDHLRNMKGMTQEEKMAYAAKKLKETGLFGTNPEKGK